MGWMLAIIIIVSFLLWEQLEETKVKLDQEDNKMIETALSRHYDGNIELTKKKNQYEILENNEIITVEAFMGEDGYVFVTDKNDVLFVTNERCFKRAVLEALQHTNQDLFA